MSLPRPPGFWKKKCRSSPPTAPPVPPAAGTSTAPTSGAALASWNSHSARELEDKGEERLIDDFGPSGKMRGVSRSNSGSGGSSSNGSSIAKGSIMVVPRTPISCRRFNPRSVLDRRITDDGGIQRRIVYDPTEIARVLEPSVGSDSSSSSNNRESRIRSGCRASRTTTTTSKEEVDADASALLNRLAATLEMALNPHRPGRESLLICKAVTDAYLVNARHLIESRAGDEKREDDYLVRSLRFAWQHAVEHWNGDLDEPHSAADLHATASWFQAWLAADDTQGDGEPTMSIHQLHGMLPGNWDWVLDHLEIAGAPEGIHLHEELETEKAEELTLKLPREIWGLADIRRALQGVSDEEWFQDRGERMIALRLFGPERASTFKREFSNILGAIYGCLKNDWGVGSTPPTFRMYTTGDIFEALGEELVLRSRKAPLKSTGGDTATAQKRGGDTEDGGESKVGEETSDIDKRDNTARRRSRVQVASLVELQVTWVGGCTHLLGWLDLVEA